MYVFLTTLYPVFGTQSLQQTYADKKKKKTAKNNFKTQSRETTDPFLEKNEGALPGWTSPAQKQPIHPEGEKLVLKC